MKLIEHTKVSNTYIAVLLITFNFVEYCKLQVWFCTITERKLSNASDI